MPLFIQYIAYCILDIGLLKLKLYPHLDESSSPGTVSPTLPIFPLCPNVWLPSSAILTRKLHMDKNKIQTHTHGLLKNHW